MIGPVIPAVRCSACGAWADTAHVLPWVTRAERVEFSCPTHDADGYAIRLDAWGQPASDTMWTHLAAKRNGLRAVAVLATALAAQQDRVDAQEAEHRRGPRLRMYDAGELLDAHDAYEAAFARATGRRLT